MTPPKDEPRSKRNTGRVKRVGRPPAGEKDGERVKDYPQLSMRLPAEVRAKLQALSMVTGRPQWRVITDAIACYLAERSDSEQRMVQALLERDRRNASKKGS